MIAIGSDHAGFQYKEKIKKLLESMNVAFRDMGTDSPESTDYPDWGHKVALEVSEGRCERGILICGTGIGMSIVANKHKGVRAAAAQSAEAARLSRAHNDANILCLGERVTAWNEAREIVKVFLATGFEGGRHQRRVDKIHTLTGL
jgi:ribose 5-phosphate isomerase B